MCVASETIKQRSMEIANWILNTRIVKSYLPANVKNLIGLVTGTKYCVNPIIRKYSEGKLNAKRITTLKNNAISHKMEILDKVDPLNQMMLLNKRKTFLLNENLILFKGIECNETLDMKFEKLGGEGEMYEKSFSSRSQVIIHKYDIDFALQSMQSDIELRIDKFTMRGSGWAVIGLLKHHLHVNNYDPLAPRSYKNRKRINEIKQIKIENDLE